MLMDTSDKHHEAFTATNGVDEDWAIWYAETLLARDDFAQLFDQEITLSKLIYSLMALDVEYTASEPEESWSDYYAEKLEHYLSKEFSN
ncbi:MAG: hypothetical protein WD061_03735 [Candidatus Saccharimonadales bacterium]